MVDVFRKYHRHHHLLDMLTEVNERVAAIANEYPEVDLSFQVPAHSHTLRKKVFFQRPGESQQDGRCVREDYDDDHVLKDSCLS